MLLMLIRSLPPLNKAALLCSLWGSGPLCGAVRLLSVRHGWLCCYALGHILSAGLVGAKRVGACLMIDNTTAAQTLAAATVSQISKLLDFKGLWSWLTANGAWFRAELGYLKLKVGGKKKY